MNGEKRLASPCGFLLKNRCGDAAIIRSLQRMQRAGMQPSRTATFLLHAARSPPDQIPLMKKPTKKAKPTAKVKMKDLKPQKNPKGGIKKAVLFIRKG